jgi:hypothetical protein
VDGPLEAASGHILGQLQAALKKSPPKA